MNPPELDDCLPSVKLGGVRCRVIKANQGNNRSRDQDATGANKLMNEGIDRS